MDLFDLFARITLDTSGYEQGIANVISTVSNAQSAINGINAPLSNAQATLDGLNPSLSQTQNTFENLSSPISEAAQATQSYNSNIEKTGDVSNSVEKALSNVVKKFVSFKIAVDAAKTTVKAITTLTKSAVENFAEYEQLVGGVETLFKDSADVVQEYAANAYKTAGLSANEYMETVTSFSASLLQSLNNDTAKAAEVADRAITDMSDNANKMGTSMESIQNAYQGFAKQNYTMLDNLKLGYGGTKEEMQRLLDDASKLANQEFDLSSYADIVEAIHVVQTEMGITGTTAEEAATTIQGSLSSMKSAWENLVTGIADENADFETLIDNFVESASTAIDNLLPLIKVSLEGIGKLVAELAPVIAEAIPELVNDVLPSIAQAAVDLVMALVNSLVDNGDLIANTALDIVDMLVTALVDNAYSITDGAVGLITSLVNGISDRLPDLVPAAVEIILSISQALIDNIDEILDAAEQLIMGLAEGLMEAIPVLLEKAGPIVISFLGELVKAVPDVIEFAVKLCTNIADYIINYDWESVGENLYENVSKAINNALHGDSDYTDRMAQEAASRIESYSKLSADRLESMITWTSHKIGEYNQVLADGINNHTYDIEAMPDWMRKAYENSGKTMESFLSENIAALQRNLEEYTTAKQNVTEALNAPVVAEWNGAKIAAEGMAAYYEEQAKAISQGGNEVTEEIKKSGEKQQSALAIAMEALERSYKQRQITEEQYQKQRLEYLNTHQDRESDEWTKYYDSVQTYYEKLTEAERQAAEKAIQETQKTFKSMLDEYDKQLTDVQKKIDSFSQNLTGAYKDFYTFTTKGDIYNEQLQSRQDTISALEREADRLEAIYGKEAAAVVNARNKVIKAEEEYDKFQREHDSSEDSDVISVEATDKMTQAGKQLEEYYNQLIEFSERGIGDDMISQLADFSREEGLATLEYWNGLTDQQLENLQAHYDKVQEMSGKIGELIYADESKQAVDSITDSLKDAVENDEQFKALGELMLESIINGLNSGDIDVTGTAYRISSELNNAFNDYFSGNSTAVGYTPSGSYASTSPVVTPIATSSEVSTYSGTQTAAVPAAESDIHVTVQIENFNNYTTDNVDEIADKVLIAIQDKINRKKAAYS